MPKKGLLGLSFPLTLGIGVVFLVLVIVDFVSGSLGKSLFGDVGLPGWLSVSQPRLELPSETVFHLFGFPITNSIIGAWLSIIVVVGFAYAVSRRLRLIPRRWQTLLEFMLGALLSFCQSVAGEKKGRTFFPIIATIFLFVVFNAWLSLLPGFGTITVHTAEGETHLLRGANTDVNLPLALAVVSFVFVEYFGLKSLGLRYLTKFFDVGRFFGSIAQLFKGRFKAGLGGLFSGVIDIFVGVLETLSELIRIVSFTFRLFGVSTAGEILILVGIFLGIRGLIEFFYGLEIIFGLVQAVVFSGLTLVFVTVATAGHGAEKESHGAAHGG